MKKQTTILLFILMLIFIICSVGWNISLKADIKGKEEAQALEIEYQAKINEGKEQRLQEIIRSIANIGRYQITIVNENEANQYLILVPYKAPIEE